MKIKKKRKTTNLKKNENYLKRFWDYLLNSNSAGSYILNLLIAFIIIKFIIFPILVFSFGSSFPIVAVVSGSMQHKIVRNEVCGNYIGDISNSNLNFSSWWSDCGFFYQDNFNITKSNFLKFPFSNGFNIGDVMIIKGMKPKNIKVGDIIIFKPEDLSWYSSHGPVIHRVVKKWEINKVWYFQTKGDHNPQSIARFETNISQSDVLGVAIIRIPYLGFPKIFLNNLIILLKRIL